MSIHTPRALVVGHGAAALGALAALRSLAPRPLRITHLTLAPRELDHGRRRLVDHTGTVHRYDTLLLSPGGRPRPAPAHAITLAHGRGEVGQLADLLAGGESDRRGPLVLVSPPEARWPLRLHALALAVRRQAGPGAPIILVTAEGRPGAAYGAAAADLLGGLLERAAIEVHTAATAAVPGPCRVELTPGGAMAPVRRVVCLPTPAGPGLVGAPTTAGGFIACGREGTVPGLEGVFAAGTATALARMHPTIGVHQGWRAGAAMARHLGAGPTIGHPHRLEARLAVSPAGTLHWWAPAPPGMPPTASPPPAGWPGATVTLPLEVDAPTR